MMKKLLLNIILTFFTVGLFAQTIVSTLPENRKVVLEEFVGYRCPVCPEASTLAQQLKDDNEGNLFIISIHEGILAEPISGEPDYRTEWGQAIAQQTNLFAYPVASINRQVFDGQNQTSGATAIGSGAWSNVIEDILDDPSYVNIAVEAEIDALTNEMTIHVEGYYTGNSPVDSNFLNIAIIQNNTLGIQTNLDFEIIDDYLHQNRLIDLVNGQWGEEITTVTSGDFVDRTYTYPIPTDHNGIPIEIGDLEVIAFVTETTQLIANANRAAPTFSNILANDAFLRSIQEIPATCDTEIIPLINVQNLGANEITSLDITYSINGGAESVYNWTGSIDTLDETDIELPVISFTATGTNTLDVSINSDENNTNNTLSSSFENAPETIGDITLTITTDIWAEEVTWDFRDVSGMILESGGPLQQDIDDLTTFTFNYNFNAECITFNLYDLGGDGMIFGNNDGGVSLTDANGVEIYSFNGNYGAGFSRDFNSNGAQIFGIEDFGSEEKIVLFPNPAKDEINISYIEGAQVKISDTRGRSLFIKNNALEAEKVDVSRMPAGTYFVEIIKDNKIITKKFIIIR